MNTPFSWQDKRVIRKIRESFDDQAIVASALSTYFALSVVASDKGADEFQTTHPWVASMAGLSSRTVGQRLSDLKEIGVIDVTTPALKAPCTYRLLPFSNGCATFGNGCRALSNGCRTFGNLEAPPLPTSEEHKEKKVHTPVQQPLPNGENAFALFWEAYPKKVAKPKAQKAFLKQGCVDAIDSILAALKIQNASPSWTKDGGQYIPYPATWLNERRWEDSITTSAPQSEGEILDEYWRSIGQ